MSQESHSRVVWEGMFSLSIPENWQTSEEDDVISVYRPDGVGALQISLARHSVSFDMRNSDGALRLAEDYINQNDWNVRAEDIVVTHKGDSVVCEFEFTDNVDALFWRSWHILGPEFLAFITYNSGAGDKNVELRVVDEIISSFEWV